MFNTLLQFFRIISAVIHLSLKCTFYPFIKLPKIKTCRYLHNYLINILEFCIVHLFYNK